MPRTTESGGTAPLLDIEGLTLELPGTARPLLADVSLRIRTGEVVGLVGESGSGKSTTAKAALAMLPAGTRAQGAVRVEGTEVLGLRGEALRAHRARTVAMVHQDPRAALNPVRRVGDFLTERLALAGLTDRGAARARAVELLESVGIPDPARRVRQRPHELSGGMLQRVVIAGALAAGPRLLLADEATSALDVTTQAEILDLLRTLRAERETGMLFITHDLHLAAAYCDRVVVMYAGRLVEHQPAEALFTRPRHPYTRGLLDCSPGLGEPAGGPAPGAGPVPVAGPAPVAGEPAGVGAAPAVGATPVAAGGAPGAGIAPGAGGGPHAGIAPGMGGGPGAGIAPGAGMRPIPGRPPSLSDAFSGCPFAARCPEAEPECETWTPVSAPLEAGGEAACRVLPEASRDTEPEPAPAGDPGSDPNSLPAEESLR